eukprot:10878637-Alexandrium_andersonii.AAC.1
MARPSSAVEALVLEFLLRLAPVVWRLLVVWVLLLGRAAGEPGRWVQTWRRPEPERWPQRRLPNVLRG